MPTFWEKVKMMLKSRKFWALIASLVGIASAFFTNSITDWQALQMLVAAFAIYSTGVAIEDSGIAR